MTEIALPAKTKLLYASSSLGGEALTQSRGVWLLYFYAPPSDSDRRALLPLGLAGALLLAVRFVDAIGDPLVGYWSDRTRSRLGRRLPFILGGTPLWALFAFLLYTPPERAGTAWIGLYLFLVFECYALFSTLSGGPYESLLPELAKTSADRMSVVSMKVVFGALGGACGLVGSGLLVDRAGFRAMALVMAGLALTFRYVGMAGVWDRARHAAPPAELSLRSAVRTTFSNRAFLVFLPSFVLFQLAFQMLLGVLPYFVNAILGVEKEGRWVAALTAVAIATVVVSLPAFSRLARRTSKRQGFRAAMLAGVIVFPLACVPGIVPGVPTSVQLVLLMVLIGVPIAGVYLFPAALTADIVDDDSLRTGMRREAMYYGSQNFVEKTATSLTPVLLAGLLLLGDTAANPLGIRLVGPVAGLVLLCGYLVFRRYDLPDDVLGASRGGER